MTDNHPEQQQQQQSQRISATATSSIQQLVKKRTRQKWESDELDTMLAWIFKNKDKWADSKKGSIKILQKDILRNHTVQSITVKLHELQQTFKACFEFATYIDNDQESEPIRHVIRERVLNFDFYKECRAAFGPPEYDSKKFKVVRKIQGTPPTPTPRPQPRPQQQERSSILKFTPVGYVTEVYIP